MTSEYLTPEEVAAQLRVTPKAVRAWCQAGKLKASRAGRRWLIKPADVQTFITMPEVKEESKKADGPAAFATRPTIAAIL
jgi:excisionase family DNA binding protein